jgi:predicted Zn-ribbon and HTH transcriptional regulator
MGTKLSDKQIKSFVEDDTSREYILIELEKSTKRNGKRYMKIQHTVCGHIYSLDIYEFKQGKRRCSRCKGKRLREHFAMSIDEIKVQTSDMSQGEYTFVDDTYVNSKTKHLFRHNNCGTVFSKKWEKFKVGQRCPNCNKKGMESGASRFVRDIFDHLNIEYEKEKRFTDCINPKTGSQLPFDYYLPEIDTLIEIDGEQHERASFSKYAHESILERDRLKDTYAKENGIELVRIPARKWSQLPEILHTILSKSFLPKLILDEVRSIPKSSHVERIDKDLRKIHNGDYSLHDNYYFGVDRYHHFKHRICGHVFRKTLSTVRDEVLPCPECKRKAREKRQHDTCNAKLKSHSNGRYSLDDTHIGVTTQRKRLVHCHRCHQSWYSMISNILSNKGGCPNCNDLRRKHKHLLNISAKEI